MKGVSSTVQTSSGTVPVIEPVHWSAAKWLTAKCCRDQGHVTLTASGVYLTGPHGAVHLTTLVFGGRGWWMGGPGAEHA